MRIALARCAAAMLLSAGFCAHAQTYSGFLDSYDGLAPSTVMPSAVSWVKPGVNWKQYHTIALDPLELWWAPNAQYRGMRADTFAIIAAAYSKAATSALQSKYTVIPSSPRLAKGTLRIRCGLTGLDPRRPTPAPLNFLPATMAIRLARSATGNELFTLSLVAECEAIDGASGQRLYAVVAPRTTTRVDLQAPLAGIAMNTLIANWAGEMRTLLDKAGSQG